MTPPADPATPLLTELDFRARSYDVDFMGIVSNIVHVRWLEDLRLRLLELYHPLENQLELGYAPILARTEISYRQPVRLGEQVHGRMWVSDLSRSRWTVTAELRVGPHPAANATQVGYFWDLQRRRPIPVPDALVRRHAAWPEPPDGG
jgi:acyl-CoA thioester hydrolase